jgi:hypothetical protein
VINLKPLQNDAARFQEPLKSIIEMQKPTMSESDFIGFFIGMRKKAREMDLKQKEATK